MLTNKERYFLRSLGNELSPIVIVGKGGVSESIFAQLDEALTARELVKCRVLPHTQYDPAEVAQELTVKTGSETVQIIGRNILIYRRPKPGKPSKITWATEE